jgi:uncharacterized protein YyaL (SSP411 family)
MVDPADAPHAEHGNRLADAISPYLLQHAANPVDWYEWGPEAFARAAERDVPILLSVGYAACHWCHVMAHESFEDPETAALMNEHFVSVKVDREERPDIDAVYMDAVQAMTGQGGWPMTVFLTPEGEPFYAGTYFPDAPRHGTPSFRQVLLALAEAWRERRSEVTGQGRRVSEALRLGLAGRASQEPLTDALLQEALRGLRSSFDPAWGGFGGAPKFPQPMTLEFLLRMHHRGAPATLDMVTLTLDRMAAGGLHDQLGGGFHRYSVDRRWHVPHFEKMLYDNALLARLYLHGWQVTGSRAYRRVTERTLDYLLREMRHRDGGFFSSQDADSEGVEGRFFVWPYQELVEAAGPHGEAVAAYLGALPEGNWEGTNVLWTPRPLEQVADEAGLESEALAEAVDAARLRLLERRERRVHPAVDDKILAAWNGLAIAALAEAGRAFGEPRYTDAAAAAAGFVLTRMVDAEGRLHRSWREGRTSGHGFLEDHAMMVWAALELYQSTFDPAWMRRARGLADRLIESFADPDGVGFYQTSANATDLLVRPKELFDNAVPSGNSVAADVLQRLSLFTGDPAYDRAGVGALRVVRDLLQRAPTAFGHALGALDLYLADAREIAVVGEPGPDRVALIREATRRFLPNAVVAAAAPEDSDAIDAVPLLAGRSLVDGRPAAYVCVRFACLRPVTTPEALAAQLEEPVSAA